MPKAPDPFLADRILAVAMRLLDRGGLEAVTMRAVAAEAGIATTTIYQRFADRETLLLGVVAVGQKELIAAVQPARSVDSFAKAYIDFFCRYPFRFDLSVRVFDARLAAGEPMPVLAMFKEILSRESGRKARNLDDLALAVASLIFGSLRSMIAAGPGNPRTADLRRACLSALKRLTTT